MKSCVFRNFFFLRQFISWLIPAFNSHGFLKFFLNFFYPYFFPTECKNGPILHSSSPIFACILVFSFQFLVINCKIFVQLRMQWRLIFVIVVRSYTLTFSKLRFSKFKKFVTRSVYGLLEYMLISLNFQTFCCNLKIRGLWAKLRVHIIILLF